MHSTKGRLAGLGVLPLLVALVAGCSPGRGVASAKPESCIPVSRAVLSQIAVGAKPGMTFTRSSGAAVQARQGVYVVAVRFTGQEGASKSAVWTVTKLLGVAAPILVADATASAYTTWSTVEEFPQYGVPLESPAISAARACLDR